MSRSTPASRGDGRRLSRGRVPRLDRAFRLLVAERRFVDQQIGVVRGDPRGVARTGVAGDDDPTSRAA